MVDWPECGFKQLTTDAENLPPITESHINGYFMHRMGLERRSVGDSQALEKGKLLLESKRTEACSVLFKDNNTYFSGICRAAMKKGVSLLKGCLSIPIIFIKDIKLYLGPRKTFNIS